MSLEISQKGVAKAADLVTILRGSLYHNIYYFYTNSLYNKVERYRDAVGFKYILPLSSEANGFLYWLVNDNAINANTIVPEGLSDNISAFMHNVDIVKYTMIAPNGVKLIGKNWESIFNISKDLSVFRCTWLSNYNVEYLNNYPNVILNVSATLDNNRFDHWDLFSINGDYDPSKKYYVGDKILVTCDLSILPSFVRLVLLNAVSNPTPSGKLSIDEKYDICSMVELSAIPAEHCHFTTWEEKRGSKKQLTPAMLSSNIISLMLSNDITLLTANFAFNKYKLSAIALLDNNKNKYCTLDFYNTVEETSINSTLILQEIKYNDIVYLQPKVNNTNKYVFTGWSDGDITYKKQIKLTSDLLLTAVFAENTKIGLNITIIPAGVGTVAQTNANGIYYPGDIAVVMASNHDEHYEFSHWSDGSTDMTHILEPIYSNTQLCAIFSDKCLLIDENGDILTFFDGTGSGDIVYL